MTYPVREACHAEWCGPVIDGKAPPVSVLAATSKNRQSAEKADSAGPIRIGVKDS
jgi:hypothetical protein